MSLEQAHNFRTTFRNRTLRYLLRVKPERHPVTRRVPEKIVLAVPPGVVASGKPPVRIYVGTEPAQFRAERVFVWSITQQRDPTRVYEIHLMKDLAGFNRRHWETTFAGYRYAVPALAGGTGRAIYNDVAQIYLADPAALFDMDMGGKGMLGINQQETSVMLLDCEKMIRVWHLAEVQRRRKHKPSLAAVHSANLWDALPDGWNARDAEYVARQSKVLHFTALHTQPWRPSPNDLGCEEHPASDLWHGLERAADAAGFTVFTKSRPSQRFQEMLDLNRSMHARTDRTFGGHSLHEHIDAVAALIRECGARTVLDYGSGKAQLYKPFPGELPESRFKRMDSWGGTKVTCYDPCYDRFAGPIEGTYDGVVCTDVLEHIADDDIPWTLDELFGHARAFVYAVAACFQARKILPNGENAHITLQSPLWWREQVTAAGQRHPGVKWVLITKTSGHSPGRQHVGPSTASMMSTVEKGPAALGRSDPGASSETNASERLPVLG